MMDEKNEYKKKENILKRMIETIVVPKYPDIQDVIISSFFFKAMRCYEVLVLTKHAGDYPIQHKISNDIETLFKMSSLDEKQINGRDYVDIHFA
jgi:hypothetical protein